MEEEDIESVEDNADIESLDNSYEDFDSKIQQCKKHMEQSIYFLVYTKLNSKHSF